MQPHDLILVAFMPTPADLHIARTLGWYRIPYKTAPKTLHVDHLAFYLPAAFPPEQRHSVYYSAPVTGHELVTRAELFRDQTDHPRANDLYFKMQLGPVKKLNRPVKADSWKRLTFLYTIGERLLAAESLGELKLAANERELLWTALHEQGVAAQFGEPTATPNLPPGVDLTVLCALGALNIAVQDPQQTPSAGNTLYLPPAFVQQNPSAAAEQVQAAVKRLGGTKPSQ